MDTSMLKRDSYDLSEKKTLFLRSLTCAIESIETKQRTFKVIHTQKSHVDRLIVASVLV